MNVLLVFVLQLVSFSNLVAQSSQDHGLVAKKGQFPYAVLFELRNKPHCSGTLATDRWVITVAHCVDELAKQGGLVAVISLLNLQKENQDVQRIPVVKVVLHPVYKKESQIYDIAMVKLESAVKHNVFPVALPINGPEEKFHLPATVTSWGKLESGQSPSNASLMYYDTPLLQIEECKKHLNRPIYHKEHSICTMHPNQLTCNVDSGSPLVQKNDLLIGIVSYELKDCSNGPVVYVSAGKNSYFIRQVIMDDMI